MEDPCTTLPVDRVNCVNPSKPKSNFVKKVMSVIRANDNDAIVENEVKNVLSMRNKFDNKPEDKTVGKERDLDQVEQRPFWLENNDSEGRTNFFD